MVRESEVLPKRVAVSFFQSPCKPCDPVAPIKRTPYIIPLSRSQSNETRDDTCARLFRTPFIMVLPPVDRGRLEPIVDRSRRPVVMSSTRHGWGSGEAT